MFHILSHIIDTVSGNLPLLSLVIILGSFFLEDLTTVVIGVLTADGIVPIPVAVLSIYIGVILSDLWLYLLGRIMVRSARIARLIDHRFAVLFRFWLENRLILTIFSARFVPGTRMITYIASGLFRVPSSTFARIVLLAVFAWVTFLFSAAYWFGNISSDWLLPVRWGVALIFLVVLFFVGRYNLRTFQQATRDTLTRKDPQ